MDVVDLRGYCLSKAGATAEYPFGPDALVMKVAGKMFAVIAENTRPASISLKCESELAIVLRGTYQAVAPGYHLNKHHWNTVTLDGSIPDQEVIGWVDDSYDLVVEKLPRRAQQRLGWDAATS